MSLYFTDEMTIKSTILSEDTIRAITMNDGEILYYFDGPKLFILRCKEECRSFFMYWIGDDYNNEHQIISEKFLLSEISDEDIDKYKNNKICLNKFLNSGINMSVVTDRFDNIEIESVDFNEVKHMIDKVKKGLYHKK